MAEPGDDKAQSADGGPPPLPKGPAPPPPPPLRPKRPAGRFRRRREKDWAAGIRICASRELRASSRRRRTYLLRLLYVGALLLYVAVVWLAVAEYAGSGADAYTLSRMAEAGKEVITSLVWFQFLALPLAAVFLTSTAFTDEFQGRSLPTLLTTPLSFWQIVAGRYAGRMVQLVVLMLASLPVLMLARVFGGVPWGFVIAGVGLTAGLTLLAGAVGLTIALGHRRLIVTILLAGAVSLFWALVPGAYLAQLSRAMLQGEPGGVVWPLLVVGLLAVAYGYLQKAVPLLENTALEGHPGGKFAAWRAQRATEATDPHFGWVTGANPARVELSPEGRRLAGEARARGRHRSAEPERRVQIAGSPIVWRDMRRGLLVNRGDKLVALAVVAIALGYLYAFAATGDILDSGGFQLVCFGIAFLAAVAMVGLSAATSITAERECGCWDLLRCSALTDGQILRDKFLVALRRAEVPVIVLTANLAFFLLSGGIAPDAALVILLCAVTGVLSAAALGTLFSARSRRSHVALMGLSITLGLLWVVLPGLLGLFRALLGAGAESVERLIYAMPTVQMVAVLDAGFGGRRLAMGFIVATHGIQWLIILALLWLTRRTFRRSK